MLLRLFNNIEAVKLIIWLYTLASRKPPYEWDALGWVVVTRLSRSDSVIYLYIVMRVYINHFYRHNLKILKPNW